ncbi:MAG TPA: sensor domain-containing diguanylate cyclase [Burkholderiaceae bacterium]|nr:sensor domain-containing diguanylate cyclase [Burkholderiaceae bacterium]
MRMAEQTRQPEREDAAVEPGFFPDPADAQIARIQRIGKRLFSVASCLVHWYDGAASNDSERSMASIEAAFCQQLPPLSTLRVVSDTRADAELAKHRSVLGAPYIRFYAGCPLYNESRVVVGNLSLIDYSPRMLDQEERQLLLDLAAQAERELRLQTVGAAQLDLLKKNKSLRRDSLLDPLIGTWNRVAIVRLVAVEKARCSNNRLPLSLVLVGVDHFKNLNDSLGQSACDTILVKIASRLRSCIRPGDALGRYIGDQLLVVLPGASHIVAESVAERMRRAITLPPELGGDASSSLTVSAGTVSTNLFPSATAEELIRQADLALYAAKGAGRNCVVQAKPVLS